MIEQRAKEFLLLDHFGADESKWLADFAEREITPYREALRVMQTALEHYAAKEKWRHDHPVSIEPMREHLHGSSCLKRAYIGNRHGWEVADKALADATALMNEGEK